MADDDAMDMRVRCPFCRHLIDGDGEDRRKPLNHDCLFGQTYEQVVHEREAARRQAARIDFGPVLNDKPDGRLARLAAEVLSIHRCDEDRHCASCGGNSDLVRWPCPTALVAIPAADKFGLLVATSSQTEHGLVRDFTGERPPIVCLCGSTRFFSQFQEANYELTMRGIIVLSVGFYPHSKAEHGHGEGVGHDSAEKVALDELHFRKIELADSVFVINPGGYIGESTGREIAHAVKTHRPVYRWTTHLIKNDSPTLSADEWDMHASLIRQHAAVLSGEQKDVGCRRCSRS